MRLPSWVCISLKETIVLPYSAPKAPLLGPSDSDWSEFVYILPPPCVHVCVRLCPGVLVYTGPLGAEMALGASAD